MNLTNIYTQENCFNSIDDDLDGLIDFQDSLECFCTESQEHHIPNASFDDFISCPSSVSQVFFCYPWIQASDATFDYFHEDCSVAPIYGWPFYEPDIGGIMGFHNDMLAQTYKEYVGVCLNTPFEAGQTYSLSMKVYAVGSIYNMFPPPSKISLYGTPNCNDIPFPGTRCPLYSFGDFYLLADQLIDIDSIWKTITLTFTPTQTINGIVIGPDCDEINLGGYFFIDNISMNNLTVSINLLSNPCSGEIELNASTSSSGGDYYWLNNGIVIAEENDSTFTSNENTTITAIYELDDNCAISDPINTSSFVSYNSQDTIYQNICFGDSILIGQNYIYNSGWYTDSLTSQSGCDSIQVIKALVLPEIKDTLFLNICNGNSYAFNNHVLTQEGYYYDTLIASNGCDSFLVLNLQVNNINIENINVNICYGETYTFNNSIISTPGVYYDTISTTNCDSITVLNLQVSNPISDTLNQLLCEGDTYYFNNLVIFEPGIYKDTLISAAGCDSIITLNLDYTPTQFTYIETSICSGAIYNFNNQFIETPGIYYDTITSSNFCDSIISLNLSFYQTSHDTIYENICYGDSIYFNNQYFNQSGLYQTNSTTNNGCDSFIFLQLYVLDPIFSEINTSICPGNSFYFNNQAINLPGTYYDTLTSNFSCDSTITLNLSLTNQKRDTLLQVICDGSAFYFNDSLLTTTGQYTDTTISHDGCDSITILNLYINSSQSTNIEMTVCASDSFEFNGNTIINQGTYSDTLPSSNGCDSIVNLTLIHFPVLQNIDTINLCAMDTYYFAGNYLTTPGTYNSTSTSINGCDSITTIILDTLTSPTSNIELTLCNSSGYFFNNSFIYNSGIYYDTLSTQTGCDSILRLTLNFNNRQYLSIYDTICTSEYVLFNDNHINTPGIYFDTLIGDNYCDSIITLHLAIDSSSQGENPIKICVGDSLFYYSKWLYSEIPKIIKSDTINPCNPNQDIIFDYCEYGHLFVPNSFTPNQDGVNDNFITKGYLIKEFEIFIFNRWGQILFQSNELDKYWDGTYQNKILKQDMYSYKILYSFINDQKLRSKTGKITLLK